MPKICLQDYLPKSVKSADCLSTGGKSGRKLGRSKILQRKMPEKQKINILWFTKDLRTRDSESLYKVMQEGCLFLRCMFLMLNFLPKTIGFRKIGKYRAKFLLESVENLKQNLAKQKIPF
jgi:hypothetical protein